MCQGPALSRDPKKSKGHSPYRSAASSSYFSYIDYVTIVGMMITLNGYHYYDVYHKCRSVDKYQEMSHKNVEIVDTPFFRRIGPIQDSERGRLVTTRVGGLVRLEYVDVRRFQICAILLRTKKFLTVSEDEENKTACVSLHASPRVSINYT
jgi:hypothetical protein